MLQESNYVEAIPLLFIPRANSVKVSGQLYKTPCTLVIGTMSCDDYPVFRELNIILVTTDINFQQCS